MAGQQYIGAGRLSTPQSVSYTGTAGTVTNVFGGQTRKIRVMVTTDAFIMTDGSTATTAGHYLPALSVEYFLVNPGEKVSAIQVAANGTLYVSELA